MLTPTVPPLGPRPEYQLSSDDTSTESCLVAKPAKIPVRAEKAVRGQHV